MVLFKNHVATVHRVSLRPWKGPCSKSSRYLYCRWCLAQLHCFRAIHSVSRRRAQTRGRETRKDAGRGQSWLLPGVCIAMQLQRKIAEWRGIPAGQALPLPPQAASYNGSQATCEGSAPRAKGRYRRHPKRDTYAPERPPTAYVIFSNRTREELKKRYLGRYLSFVETAKIVGESWRRLSRGEREPYEQ